MASFDRTVELERALLNILLSGQVMLKLNIHKVRDYFFTSNERRFIFEVVSETSHASQSGITTRTIFEYAVSSRIPDGERQYYLGEWNIIEGAKSAEPPEILVQKLEDAHAGRQLSMLGDEIDALLESGRIKDAVVALKRKAVTISTASVDRPISDLKDIATREATLLDKRLHPEKYRGLRTGFRMFDDCTGGLFPGELTLVAGLTGTGKSTFVRQVQSNVVRLNLGKNVLHIANEEYLEQVEHKFDSNLTNIPYLQFKRGTISDDELERWRDYMRKWNHGSIFIKEVPAFTDVTLVEQAYRELESKGIKIDLITIDHLPHVKPIQQYFDQNDERAKAASDCKEIARWLRLPVLIPTQAATAVEEKQKRGTRGDKLDVYGSKAQVHVANTFVLITTRGWFEDQILLPEWERDVRWLADIKKNRDGPPFWFELRHHVKVGRVEEIGGSGAKGAPADEVEAQGQLSPENEKGSPVGSAQEAIRAIMEDGKSDGVPMPKEEKKTPPAQAKDSVPSVSGAIPPRRIPRV